VTKHYSLVAAGAEYTLSSAPDGVAYVLTYKSDSMAAHLQGEDATRFQTDYQTILAQYPNWPADQTLAQLWDQGGYGWLAQETI
jgi:hypothetical protein